MCLLMFVKDRNTIQTGMLIGCDKGRGVLGKKLSL